MTRRLALTLLFALALAGLAATNVTAEMLTKPQVANLISKVENGTDEFQKYLEQRGEDARNKASTAQTQTKRSKRGTASESQKATAQSKKDDLNDALNDLNRSTNRLKRKFNGTEKWMETKAQVEQVLGDGQRINQEVVRGNYGSEVARLWATLRTGINELARAYGCKPLAI
jgi:flagellar motor protein MotB